MTVEEIREALAADEMSGIARWHMVKTLLAEVDSLRARLAVAEKARDAAIDREHDTTERLLAADAALAAAREEVADIRAIIEKDLDRDKNEHDSARDLACVAMNGLVGARASIITWNGLCVEVALILGMHDGDVPFDDRLRGTARWIVKELSAVRTQLAALTAENAALREALEPLIKYANDSKLIALRIQHFEEAARVKALAVAGDAALHPATKEST